MNLSNYLGMSGIFFLIFFPMKMRGLEVKAGLRFYIGP